MKSITVTQTTNKKVTMIVGPNTNLKLVAKTSARENVNSNIEIDIMCTDRGEQDLIEAFLKKKRYKFSEDFSFQSRSGDRINPGWTDHVLLRGEKSEKMLKQICDMLEIELTEVKYFLS